MRWVLFCVFILGMVYYANSQEAYLPLNLKLAYENGSRDYSGKPGVNYTQNSANYDMQVSFDPARGILKGSEDIIYMNRSNDTLDYLVVRMYQNIFKKGNKRSVEVNEINLHNGIQLNKLIVEGINYLTGSGSKKSIEGTNMKIYLDEPLLPGDLINLQIEWRVKMPQTHAQRFGRYHENSWFVALWYPQIAVYDDIDGWDELDYNGIYEFYNDFNNYRIEINVPSDYMVWCTGVWQNAHEILSTSFFNRYRQADKSDQVVKIIKKEEIGQVSVFKPGKSNTYVFNATQVPDVAFAVSKEYAWDAVSVTTDSTNELRTTVHAVYHPSSVNFDSVARWGAGVVKNLTFSTIGVPFPYPQITLFEGQGGMEFPMMVNQGDMLSPHSSFYVTMHEIAHSYFPFLTGCNERKYAWMDEGLVTYLPLEMEELQSGFLTNPDIINLMYLDKGGYDSDVSLLVPSYQLPYNAYWFHAYHKPALAYSVIEHQVGREVFRSFIREFIDRWKGKHPTGYDFLFTLEDFVYEDLDWLIIPWFYQQGVADVGIEGARQIGDELDIVLRNYGNYPVPVKLKVTFINGEVREIHRKPEIWKRGQKEYKEWINVDNHVKKVELDGLSVPDMDPRNNQFIIN